MGLFTWIATTAKKSEAASLIQQYFEVSKKIGIFSGDPAATANRLTELACNRVPYLPEKYRGAVLAVSVLAIVITEEDISLDDRDQIAIGLFSMIKAAALQQHKHSYQDQEMLVTAYRAYIDFREIVPDAPYEPRKVEPISKSTVKPVAKPVAQTSRERERTMDELIKRMQT
ncbi:MAG: hypothetical protein EOP04_23965 [Proteobacteria bacterium]|nr:MAG: hypothetical protein EOP04_23965 [Pseudomonadota bacterium]